MQNNINPLLAGKLSKASQILGFLVFLTGLLSLLGWEFDILTFKRIISSFPIIAPNTSFAFFLAGLVLLFASDSRSRKNTYFSHISRFFSGVIALIGFLTLLEYIFGTNFGIDNFIFAEEQGSFVVRMSPQSAFNFLMAGISLLFIIDEKKEEIKKGQAIILLAGAVSLVSFFGFVYNISSFYTIEPYKGMAAPTAIAFVMLFSGILIIRAEYGFMRLFVSSGLSGLAARRLIFTLFAMISAEILATISRRMGFFGVNFELFLHLVIIAGAFTYLIFFAFRSLDSLGRMEASLEKSKLLDRAKTEFVGLASHQLRTPLTSVSWYTEMLLKGNAGKFNKKQEEYLKEIYDGNQRMISLVDDLLNTSRIDMGTLKIKPEFVDLIEIMENSLNDLLPESKKINLKIEKKFGRNLPRVLFDPELLGIVFQNVLSNAVKYSKPKGKVIIEIKRENSHIIVKIADNGYGIPANQQKKIFTKLFRADNVRERDTEGTGLGLYIAQAIVKKSNGKMRFESKENKGTTFYITFKI